MPLAAAKGLHGLSLALHGPCSRHAKATAAAATLGKVEGEGGKRIKGAMHTTTHLHCELLLQEI